MNQEKDIQVNERKEITKETELLEAGYPEKTALSLYDANIRTIGDLIGIYKSALNYIPGIGGNIKEKIITHTYCLGFVFNEENRSVKKMNITEETEIWKAGYSSRATYKIFWNLREEHKSKQELNIKDLININTYEIKKWYSTGKKTYNEIIDHTHELGFQFADEIESNKIISKETLIKQLEMCSTPEGEKKLYKTLNFIIEENNKNKRLKYLRALSMIVDIYNENIKKLINE